MHFLCCKEQQRSQKQELDSFYLLIFDFRVRHVPMNISIEPFDTYYILRTLLWTGHVARMALTRARRKTSHNWGSELDADAEFNFFYPPAAGRGRS
jgi:hypothetical protein